jgi:hypothetical protein
MITDFINSLLQRHSEKERVALSLIAVFSLAGRLLPLFVMLRAVVQLSLCVDNL